MATLARRLHLFRVGTIRGGYPVVAYLVQTVDGRNVLVDTGYRPGSRVEGEFIQVAPDETIVSGLARLGIAPEGVDLIVATHLDEDHAGYLDAFPRAEIVVQRAALASARASNEPRFTAARPFWDAPGLRFREIEGDHELLPGIEIVESGGHVPGHQSVLVRLPETGPVLLAIDAIPIAAMAEPSHGIELPMDMDGDATRASARRLVELARRERATLVVFGHDPEQWATLRLAPESYA